MSFDIIISEIYVIIFLLIMYAYNIITIHLLLMYYYIETDFGLDF